MPDSIVSRPEPLDLSQISDISVLRMLADEKPEFVDILATQLDHGRSDEEIILLVCQAGGSAQLMRYAKKCLRALRALATHAAPDRHERWTEERPR